MVEKNKKFKKVKKDKKAKLLFHPDTGLIEVDGKFFKYKTIKFKKIGKITHEDFHIWEEIKLGELDELKSSIRDKLKDHIKTERIAEEVIKDLTFTQLERLQQDLNSPKVKIKTHDGCYGLEIDTGKKRTKYLEIFE